MKNIVYLLLLSGILLFSRCNTPQTTNPNASTWLVKSSTYTTAGSSVSFVTQYTYNNKNQVTEITFTGGARESYYYSTDLVSQDDYNGSGGWMETKYYYLNSKGFADSCVEQNSGIHHVYKYDNDGHLIEHKTYNTSGSLSSVKSYTITNGNVTATTQQDGLGNTVLTQSTTFFTDKPNSIGNKNLGQGFRGVGDKNLLNHLDQTTTLVYSEDHTYTFDTKGRAEIMTVTGAGMTQTFSFTYY